MFLGPLLSSSTEHYRTSVVNIDRDMLIIESFFPRNPSHTCPNPKSVGIIFNQVLSYK